MTPNGFRVAGSLSDFIGVSNCNGLACLNGMARLRERWAIAEWSGAAATRFPGEPLRAMSKRSGAR